MIRIVGYGRESTREQAEEGFNLDEQERRINEYVDLYYADEEIEYSLIREEGASARSLKRPKMNVVLDKIRNDEVDVLIVHNLDRLTRNLVDMQQLLELFEEKHVQLVSLKEHVDTTTPQGRFFVNIMILIAQWEEDTIADRTVRGMRESARQGNYAKPKIPLGYYRNPDNTKKLLINQEEAEVVRDIFISIAVKNMTPFTVAKRLRADRILKRRWTDATVLSIIQNKAYYGTFEWFGELYDEHVPAIISKDLWNKANACAQARKFQKHNYLFKGKVHCKDCNNIYDVTCTTKKNGTTYQYQRCPVCGKYMNEDKILYAIKPQLDELTVHHRIYTDLRQYRKKWKDADADIKRYQYWKEYLGFDPDYANQEIESNVIIKEEADKEIRLRKPAIDALKYGYLSEDEASELVETYVDHIDVDLNGHLAFLSYKDEYRRIMKYVF